MSVQNQHLYMHVQLLTVQRQTNLDWSCSWWLLSVPTIPRTFVLDWVTCIIQHKDACHAIFRTNSPIYLYVSWHTVLWSIRTWKLFNYVRIIIQYTAVISIMYQHICKCFCASNYHWVVSPTALSWVWLALLMMINLIYSAPKEKSKTSSFGNF